MLHALPRVGICTIHVGFNVIYLVALLVDQHGDVHEDLMELQQMLLNLFHCVVPFLNLSDRLDDIAAPLFPNCFLQKSFTLTSADHILNGLFVCILPCDSVIPAQKRNRNSHIRIAGRICDEWTDGSVHPTFMFCFNRTIKHETKKNLHRCIPFFAQIRTCKCCVWSRSNKCKCVWPVGSLTGT